MQPGRTMRYAREQRATYGTFHWHQWREFYAVIGLAYTYADLPDDVNGIIYNAVVCLRRDMGPAAEALTAWHEAGHFLMHDGNAEWWSRMPQGGMTLARFERQAQVFAVCFPVWEEE